MDSPYSILIQITHLLTNGWMCLPHDQFQYISPIVASTPLTKELVLLVCSFDASPMLAGIPEQVYRTHVALFWTSMMNHQYHTFLVVFGITKALMDRYGWCNELLESHRMLVVMDRRNAIYSNILFVGYAYAGFIMIMVPLSDDDGIYLVQATILNGDGNENMQDLLFLDAIQILAWHSITIVWQQELYLDVIPWRLDSLYTVVVAGQEDFILFSSCFHSSMPPLWPLAILSSFVIHHYATVTLICTSMHFIL